MPFSVSKKETMLDQKTIKKPHYLEFEKHHPNDDKLVNISVAEFFEKYNITIKRIYFIETDNNKSKRGNHAHINQDQILILQEGFAKLVLTNSNGKKIRLEINKTPLLVPAGYWIELFMSENTKIMCLASQTYKHLKSITDKSVFLKIDNTKK
jgi:oxalate decarboxylase/phosphoglucose isomerase-like protein (cupin superfamily)